MADPYWRYSASADRVTFPGYKPSDASTLSSQPWWHSHSELSSSSEYLQKDILGSRSGVGIGARPEPISNGYSDPYLIGRRDVIHGTGPGIADILNDRPDSLRKTDGISHGGRESDVLFVDGLPTDCSRREVSHLFRPFRGFKEIRLVHKEPRQIADKAKVLCFVEFTDPNHASTALGALQGYKFDYKKPDSPALRIHFAHFPFKLPPDDGQFPSQTPPDSAHVPSQPPPTSAHFSSQLSTRLPHDSVPFPSEPPPSSSRFPYQLPHDTDVFPSKLPHDSAHYTSQLPHERAHSPFQISSHREEQDLATPREQGLAVKDESVVATKKVKLSSSKKKARAEAFKNQEKKWCIKCKQNHFGECYNFKGCYICGKTGHIGKECNSKPRLCYGCGEPGHIHALCPNGPRPEKKGSGNGGMVVDPPGK